jgi:hypothetical protein
VGGRVGVFLRQGRDPADGRGSNWGAPSTRAIDRIKTAIVNNLPTCRAEWWMKVGTCCLDNRWVRASRDGSLTVLTRREAGAVQIGRASYEPQAEQLNLTMKDGTNLTMKCCATIKVRISDNQDEKVVAGLVS